MLGLAAIDATPGLSAPQCRVVKITIRGDEGVPVQVDGEAWIQPPGIIKIQHKNRAQMLTRDRVSLGCSAGPCWDMGRCDHLRGAMSVPRRHLKAPSSLGRTSKKGRATERPHGHGSAPSSPWST